MNEDVYKVPHGLILHFGRFLYMCPLEMLLVYPYLHDLGKPNPFGNSNIEWMVQYMYIKQETHHLELEDKRIKTY